MQSLHCLNESARLTCLQQVQHLGGQGIFSEKIYPRLELAQFIALVPALGG